MIRASRITWNEYNEPRVTITLEGAFDIYAPLGAAGTPDECTICDGFGFQSGAHTERVNDCPQCFGTGRKKPRAA